MTREEKCVYLIDKGYTYNSQTGEVKNPKNVILKSKLTIGYNVISFKINKKSHLLSQHIFGWYYMYGECVKSLDHINRIKDDNRISNLRSVSTQENNFNREAKGYTWNKINNKWKLSIIQC